MEIISWIVGIFIAYMTLVVVDVRRRHKQYESIILELKRSCSNHSFNNTRVARDNRWNLFCYSVYSWIENDLDNIKHLEVYLDDDGTDEIIEIMSNGIDNFIKIMLMDMIVQRCYEKRFTSWVRKVDIITVEKDLKMFMEERSECGVAFVELAIMARIKFNNYLKIKQLK
ncbi:MAG: hypothetical protein Q4B71_01705 [Cardiobacteriaceae bacterium]|nr:hypothetical protein [Cardiobacteriaceae bacterium]